MVVFDTKELPYPSSVYQTLRRSLGDMLTILSESMISDKFIEIDKHQVAEIVHISVQTVI